MLVSTDGVCPALAPDKGDASGLFWLAADARLGSGDMRCARLEGSPESLERRVLSIKTRWGARKVGDVSKALLAQDLPEPPRYRGAGHAGNIEVIFFCFLIFCPGVEGDLFRFGLILF
jgi:hypothetical protein